MRTTRFLSLIIFLLIFFSCSKDYSYEGGPAAPIPEVLPVEAMYSLVGSPNSCSNITVEGSYKIGTPLNSTNKVVVQVKVTQIGTYFIAVTNMNGMSFNAVGEFTTVGIQNLTLQGEGTPNKEGDNLVEITDGISKCSLAIKVVI
jgi:hypothetical protein